MGKTFNMVGGGSLSPDLPIGSHINVTSDVGATIQCKKGILEYTKVVGRLPSGYTEVEYIENSGTQYIDTGLKNTTNFTKIKTSFAFLAAGCSPFGSAQYDVSPYNFSGFPYRNNSNANLLYVGTSASISLPSIALNTMVDFELTANNNSVTYKIDGTEYSTTYTGTVSNPYNIYLLMRNAVGTAKGSSCRLKETTFYDANDNIIGNFVPCKNSSDEFGMYDLVTETFFGNSGTGSFTGGSPVTQGTVSFEIHHSGTWTVKAEKTGESPLTETVSVADDDTDYNVTLTFWDGYLFKNGDQYISHTGGWNNNYPYPVGLPSSCIKNGTFSITDSIDLSASHSFTDYHNYHIFGTTNLIDVTDYNTLTLRLDTANLTNGGFTRFGLTDNTKITLANTPANTSLSNGVYTYNIDISNIIGSYYVFVGWASMINCWGDSDIGNNVDISVTSILLS